MRLWIDDEREAPEGWTRARNRNEAIAIIDKWFDFIEIISFDHDLGDGPTGYDIATTLEKMVRACGYCPMQLEVHSANPVGRRNIERVIDAIDRYLVK